MIGKEDIEAFILAGGKSSRMGSEKGLVHWKGKTFVEHILQVTQAEFNKVSIISNTDAYDHLGVPIRRDLISGKGPLGGVYTGLCNTNRKYAFFVSCDIPLIHSALIRHLLSQEDAYDMIVPVHSGTIEPLCGIYNKRCARLIGGLLKHQKLSVTAALKYFNVKYVEISKEPFYSHELLSNINSKEELKKLEEHLYEHQN